jgi:hypothetical protein
MVSTASHSGNAARLSGKFGAHHYAQTDWAVYLAARTQTTISGSANDPKAIPVPVASAQE